MESPLFVFSSLYNLWRTRKTSLEMIADRGYKTEEKHMPLSEWVEKYKKYTSLSDSKVSDKEAMEKELSEKEFYEIRKHMEFECRHKELRVIVLWLDKEKIQTNDVRKIFLHMQGRAARKCIAICTKSPTAQVHPELKMLDMNGYNIEIFLDCELYFNPSKHVLVPKHEICGEKEKLNVIEKYGFTLENFEEEIPPIPKININDIMVRYLGGKKGQFLKITRKSNILFTTTGEPTEYIVYRCIADRNIVDVKDKIKRKKTS